MAFARCSLLTLGFALLLACVAPRIVPGPQVAPRIVAAGVTDGGAGRSGLPPVHLGLSDSVYAFERSDADATLPGIIEVHSVDDGSLLLRTRSDEPVAELLVGGTTLAVLEASAGTRTSDYRLQVADLGDPELRTVADRTSAAAISQDGSYLAWDVEGGGAGTGVADEAAEKDAVRGRTMVPFRTDPGAGGKSARRGPAQGIRPDAGPSHRFFD